MPEPVPAPRATQPETGIEIWAEAIYTTEGLVYKKKNSKECISFLFLIFCQLKLIARGELQMTCFPSFMSPQENDRGDQRSLLFPLPVKLKTMRENFCCIVTERAIVVLALLLPNPVTLSFY